MTNVTSLADQTELLHSHHTCTDSEGYLLRAAWTSKSPSPGHGINGLTKSIKVGNCYKKIQDLKMKIVLYAAGTCKCTFHFTDRVQLSVYKLLLIHNFYRLGLLNAGLSRVVLGTRTTRTLNFYFFYSLLARYLLTSFPEKRWPSYYGIKTLSQPYFHKDRNKNDINSFRFVKLPTLALKSRHHCNKYEYDHSF